MMLSFIPACILTVMLLVSLVRERRRFRNGVYLFFALMFWYMFVLEFSFSYSLPTLWQILVLLLLIGVPLSMFGIAVLLIIDGVIVIRREGLCLRHALPILFGLLIFVMLINVVFLVLSFDFQSHPYLTLLFFYIFFLSCYISITFVSFVLFSLLYTLIPKNIHCDYILIHGMGLLDGERVSPLFAARIEKGIKLYEKGGRCAKIIASGGRGTDEQISEARAIRQYLLNRGVPETDILLEEQSETTLENLLYSKHLMDARGSGYTCLFVSNNFHIFRTSLLARQIHLNGEGVGCRTALYYWPSAFLREYVALFVRFRKLFWIANLIFLGLTGLVLLILFL